MNVGVCVSHSTANLRERFENAVNMGFHHCQLISWSPALWTPGEAETVRCLCREFDMEITAFWCGWEGPKIWDFYAGPETLGLVPPAYRYARMKNLCDGADFAQQIGVTDVVSHMGFIPEVPTDHNYAGVVEALRAVAKHCAAHGQNLLFETGQETPVTLLRLVEDIGTGNLYLNLDPANLVLYGKANPVDSLDVFGSLVRGVHAKDGLYPTDGRNLGKEVKIGEGKVDFPALLKGLKSHGFDGSLTIEREISGEQKIMDIREAKNYLEEIIARL